MIRVAELSVYPKYFRWEFPKGNFNIEDWIKAKKSVFDADTPGNQTSYWVVDEDSRCKFYRAKHFWDLDYGTSLEIYNEFEIREICISDMNATKYARMNLNNIVLS